MPTTRHRYTLFGFSDDLDWRALNFVDPIPPNIVFKACGLVTRVTAFLPCLHVFCKKCYEQCRDDGGHCCPLDGQHAVEEDVQWIEYPVGNLLKRKVKCWNEDRDCEKVLSASELQKHFCKDCDHHSTSCPRCSMVVHCNNVCAHLQSQCRDHEMPVASENLQTSTTGEKGVMMAWNAKLDTRVCEINERLDHLTHENSVQSNRLKEISHCMNAMRETLLGILSRSDRFDSIAFSSEAIRETLNDHGEMLQQLAGTMNNSHETLKDILEGTKRSLEQQNEHTANILKADLRELFRGEGNSLKETLQKELKDAARTICSDCAGTVSRIVEVKEGKKQTISSTINSERTLALIRVNVKRHEFIVEGFKAKKESALLRGYCLYEKGKMYISGYRLSPGVYFKKEGQHVYLHPRIQLHKGMIDDLHQWPLKEKVLLTIKHPLVNKPVRVEGVPANDYEVYAKPDKASNARAYFQNCSFSLDYLEREGYVADDKLRVLWELVSEN